MTYGFDEIRVTEKPVGTIITLVFKDKLKKEDYEHFVPQVEKIMERRDKIRMVVEFLDFKGWTPGAFWEDAKFGFRHFSDIERLAIIGSSNWEKTMTAFAKPFTGAEVQYFDVSQKDQADAWISA